MSKRLVQCTLAAALILASDSALARMGDPGTGPGGSGSPSSQPEAAKQAGPYGHCWIDALGREKGGGPRRHLHARR